MTEAIKTAAPRLVSLSGVLFLDTPACASLIISRYLHNAQITYGHFAAVIIILWWFYPQSVITMLGAQLNAVPTERLHSPDVDWPPDTQADQRAYNAYAKERTYHEEEHAEADFPLRRPLPTSIETRSAHQIGVYPFMIAAPGAVRY